MSQKVNILYEIKTNLIKFPIYNDGDICITDKNEIFICNCFSPSDTATVSGIHIRNISNNEIRTISTDKLKSILTLFHGKIILTVD